jgi:hypothetical protein
MLNIAEDISTGNIEEMPLVQTPDVNLKTGDNAKFSYETKKRTRNLAIEVSAVTRKLLIQKKVQFNSIQFICIPQIQYRSPRTLGYGYSQIRAKKKHST